MTNSVEQPLPVGRSGAAGVEDARTFDYLAVPPGAECNAARASAQVHSGEIWLHHRCSRRSYRFAFSPRLSVVRYSPSADLMFPPRPARKFGSKVLTMIHLNFAVRVADPVGTPMERQRICGPLQERSVRRPFAGGWRETEFWTLSTLGIVFRHAGPSRSYALRLSTEFLAQSALLRDPFVR